MESGKINPVKNKPNIWKKYVFIFAEAIPVIMQDMDAINKHARISIFVKVILYAVKNNFSPTNVK